MFRFKLDFRVEGLRVCSAHPLGIRSIEALDFDRQP